MKVHILRDRCVGQGMCYLACPEIFEPDEEDGHAIVLQEDVPPHLEEAARQAERSCPEQAIVVT